MGKSQKLNVKFYFIYFLLFRSEERTGCVVLVGVDEVKFSGMFSYHVATNTWTKLYDDIATSVLRPEMRTLKCRTGHSMLFHPVSYYFLDFINFQLY